jgi:predicted metal-dependent HD superfamily phosphohydrolase
MPQQNRFLNLLAQLHCQFPAKTQHQLWQQLVAAYSQPQRHYHTTEHIDECLQLFDHYRHLARHPAEVEFALWFHDVVYQPQATDNELQSAHWAIAVLQQGGVCKSVQQRIYALILATQHGIAMPQTADEQLLVDIDLAIFAAPPARFSHYQQQIRREYAPVPEAIFQQKRLEFLTTFAHSKIIYHTPTLREELEPQARLNLQHAIADLQISVTIVRTVLRR